MKHIVLFFVLMSLLISCTPQEILQLVAEINDEMTRLINPDVETDSKIEDAETRPISPVVDDTEIDYGQKVWDALYECFLSSVVETEDPNTFIDANGTEIRIVEQEKYLIGERLSEADKANGMVWKGIKWIDIIYFDKESNEWEDNKLFFFHYRYYEDGKITQWNGKDETNYICWPVD
jgi:hypothetical protein